MDWYHSRMSQLPTQAEIDSLYFHLAMLIVAGLLLAFSLGVVVGSRMRSQSSAKCTTAASSKELPASYAVPLCLDIRSPALVMAATLDD
jgi:hypothetical protein